MTPGHLVRIAGLLIAAAAVGGCATTPTTPAAVVAEPPAASTPPTVASTPPAYGARLDAASVALLPEARYDAVIPNLSAAESGEVPDISTTAYALDADAAVYAEDRSTPVARLSEVDFLGEPTVVVAIEVSEQWTKVLLPSRQRLPSESDGDAPAQTSGWVRRDQLVSPVQLAHRIVVSVSAQTLTIIDESGERTFAAGVGAAGTPTPTGVTGYLQARYLDPAQGQSEHRVQLTSLHSAASDDPLGGSDGGLIGVHHSDVSTGAVSHGCIRVAADALTAVDALPLGTPITVLQ